MPAAPECLDTVRCIWIVKVFFKRKAEHGSHADSHIAVAAEIEIDLEHIGDRTDPGGEDVELTGAGGKDRVCRNGHRVGNHNFFCEAEREAPHPGGRSVQRNRSVVDRAADIMIFHDRSRDQLGKKGNIQQQLSVILLAGSLAAINIDRVAHGLEGEKRDADRQRDSRQRKVPMQNGVQRGDKHVGIFEYTQQSQIEQDRHRQKKLAAPGFFVNTEREQIIQK